MSTTVTLVGGCHDGKTFQLSKEVFDSGEMRVMPFTPESKLLMVARQVSKTVTLLVYRKSERDSHIWELV